MNATVSDSEPTPLVASSKQGSSRWHVRFAASGALEIIEGIAPSALVGGNMGMEVLLSPDGAWIWGTRLSAAYAPPRTSALAVGSGTFWFESIRLDECPFAWRMSQRVSLLPCGNFEVGRLLGRGVQSMAITNATEFVARWYAGGVSTGVRVAWPEGWDVELLGAVSFPLVRDAFLVRQASTVERVHVPGVASARIGIGLGRHFP